MGSVWLAEHRGLGTNVVVKFMMAELALDTASVARFSREAAAASQVKSPHVVQTLDHGVTAEGIPFIVMELLEGHDLAKHLAQRGALSPEETLAIVDQLCKALDRAHQKGIVHRDIKPENIFLCDVGHGEVFVKLLDFGIAKTSQAQAVGSATRTGVLIGTPYYMSPEQGLGAKTIDHRTDLWSVGVVTFECLTGKKPFDGDTITALALAVHHGPIPVPSHYAPSLPPAVDAWFARACARNVAERPASARALSDELRQALGAAPRLSATGPAPGQSSSWSGQGSALSTSTASAVAAVPAALPMRSNQPLLLGLVAVVLFAAGGFAAWKRFGPAEAPPLAAVPSAAVSSSPAAAAPENAPSPLPTEKAAPATPAVAPVAPVVAVAAPSSAAAASAVSKSRPRVAPTVKPAAPVKAAVQPKIAPAAPETKAAPKPRASNRDDIE